tara:strand:- start:7542 stop:7820 length:279 start_codon:yes stop_codon:yes gene_type:complete
MSYTITSYTKSQAKKYGLVVKPSKVKGKKIDVFKNGDKVASVGAIGYSDYPTYIKSKGLQYAKKRRILYKKRHQKDRLKRNTNSWYADKLLW